MMQEIFHEAKLSEIFHHINATIIYSCSWEIIILHLHSDSAIIHTVLPLLKRVAQEFRHHMCSKVTDRSL